MITRKIIFPYKMGSESARELQRELGGRTIRVYPDGKYKPFQSHLIVNWGNTQAPSWYKDTLHFLNKPAAVEIANNKLLTFQKLQQAGVLTPRFTTLKEEALNYEKIICRRLLRASEGRGIEVHTPDTLKIAQNCPLYVENIPPYGEYRVHVFRGLKIDYSKKFKPDADGNPTDPKSEDIRNHDHGWSFVRYSIDEIPDVVDTAIKAVAALGLDFGGVDIIRRKNKSYVLEVNTACGLSDSGLQAYAQAINSYAATL